MLSRGEAARAAATPDATPDAMLRLQTIRNFVEYLGLDWTNDDLKEFMEHSKPLGLNVLVFLDFLSSKIRLGAPNTTPAAFLRSGPPARRSPRPPAAAALRCTDRMGGKRRQP